MGVLRDSRKFLGHPYYRCIGCIARSSGAWAYPGTVQVFLSTRSVLSQEWVKLYTNFKFCTHIHRVDRNKTPLKIRKRNRGRTQRLSKIFRAPIYMYKAHHAVIFTVAQLSSMNLTLESNLFREFWVRDLLLQ